MSTVLEKAVLLDETGQLIVDKLDDIKEAIGNSGEYIPLAIRVTTPPTKVSYYDGDALDLSGIVVSLVGSNGSLIDVTSACTFSPTNRASLSTSDTSVSITYHYEKDDVDFTASQDIIVSEIRAVSLEVTTPPTKTEYYVGDALDLSGMVVTATYNNGTTADVTAHCRYSPADGDTLDSDTINKVYINYTGTGVALIAIQHITVSNPIYGVEWDGTSSPAWTRTDGAADFTDPVPQMSAGNGGWTTGSSPFDTIAPWKDIKRVEDATAGTLVEIPKFYYKWTRDGAKMKLQISSIEQDGFFVSPAHSDRGDGQGERDFIYVGAYHCATSTLKSTSGVTPQHTKSLASFRSEIHALGSDIWQWDFATFWTISMLYLVEFANWNSQEKIGYGCGNNSAPENNGATDSMTYHTGTNKTNKTTYGHTRYRYIEDLWGNVNDNCDGIYFSQRNIYAIKNPANFSNASGGINVGTRASSNGVPTEWTNPTESGFEYALYPSNVVSDSSYTTYACDYSSYYSSHNGLVVGGSFYQQNSNGLFYLVNVSATDGGNTSKGSRLMKLPNNS